MKIFITGATGFVGYYIAEKLIKEGHSLTVLYRTEGYGYQKIKNLTEKTTFIKGDINNYELLDECLPGHDIIIHAAATVSFNSLDSQLIDKTNVHGTTNLINCAIANNIQKFIYISSIAALGGHHEQIRFDESAEWDPKIGHHSYAISKHNAEMEIWRGSVEGLDTCILSPSLVIGKWDESHHSMQLFKKIKSGNPFYTPGSKGWVDARDIGNAVAAVINKKVYNQRIILNGHNESLKKVLSLGAIEAGKIPPRFKLPYGLLMTGVRLMHLISKSMGLKNILTPELVKSMYSHREFDNSKSIALLDIKYTPLPDSIRFALGT